MHEHTHRTSWGYIAGFTDGEGYIGRVGRSCRIVWGQNSVECLESMAAVFREMGANPCIYRRPAKPPKQPNVSWVLVIAERKWVAEILQRLIPYLIVKHNAAVSMLEWIEANPRAHNIEPVPEDELIRLHQEGFTQKAIAKRLGYGPIAVSKVAARLGLKFRTGGLVKDGIVIPAMTHEQHIARRAERERKPCPDCGYSIFLASTRCRPCAVKHRSSVMSNTRSAAPVTNRSGALAGR